MPDRSMPVVSTVIPVYNGERYLAEAIESALAQDYPRHEILVVDDGSTDSTAAIVHAHPTVRYIRQPNQGHGVAKNTGIEAATGEYVAFLDADDLWTPNKLSLQLAYLRANPGAQAAICLMETLLDGGMDWPATMNEAHYRKMPPAYVPSALIVHVGAFERIGLFSPEFSIANDSDWFFRARDAGLDVIVAPHVLLRRRLHQNNQSYQAHAAGVELLQVVRASVLRTRGRMHSDDRQ